MKRKITLFTLFVLSIQFLGLKTYAQFGGIGDMTSIYKLAQGDASYLLSGYMKPFGNGFCAGLNNGWYNTAKMHKILGFDITVNLTLAAVPTADKTFDVSSFNRNITTTNPLIVGKSTVTGNTKAPTIGGADVDGPQLTYSVRNPQNGQYEEVAQFNTPQGSGFGYVPVPMAQIGIGLIKQTEIILRLFPTQKIGDSGSIGLWGFGIKHSIKQWIPGISDIKFFNLSALFGYTKLTSKAKLDLGTDVYPPDAVITPANYSNQEAKLVFSGWTLDAIASLDVPVISLYVGLGISPSKSRFQMTGNYPVTEPTITIVNNEPTLTNKIVPFADPLDIRLDDKGLKPHATVGAKLKLFVLHIHASYSIAKYNMFNAGVGLSIR